MSAQFAVNGNRTYRAGNYLVIYISNPEQSLDFDQQEALLQSLGPAASRGFGHQVTADSLRRHMLVGQSYLFVAKREDTFTGFMSAENLPDSISPSAVYLSGVVLSSGSQGKGLGSAMLRYLLEVSKCKILAFTTQSPVMYLMLKKVSKVVHPGLKGEPIPPKLQETGKQIMEGRRGEFCPTTFVNRNLYPHCLYPEFPWCSDL